MSYLYERYIHIKEVEILDESHISVTAYSPWGTVNSMELPVGLETLDDWAKSDKLIQDTGLKHLTSEQREFLMTGMTTEEWDGIFGLFEVNDE